MITSHNGPKASDRAARFVLHDGGQLATITFPTADGLPGPASGGGLRGKIRGFSPASRSRLLRRIAAVNKLAYTVLPTFVTLTYPREYPTDPTEYRRHARAFLKRLYRKYGDRPVIWRLEFQKRGAPHYHLLVWDLPSSPSVEEWVREAWFEVVGSGDEHHQVHGVHVRPTDSWRRVSAYLAKYIAKPADAEGEVQEPVGRWWGVERGKMLQTDPVSFVTTVREGLKIRRAMQKYAGIRRPGGQDWRGCSAFIGDDAACRLVVYYGGRLERPTTHQPEDAESPPGRLRDAGRAWRMARHRDIEAGLRAAQRALQHP